MKWIDRKGETCLVVESNADLLEAYRSSKEVRGEGDAVTCQLWGLIDVVTRGVPLEMVNDIEATAGDLVIEALVNCASSDPWRQDQRDMMIAGLGKPALSMAA